MSAEIQTVRTIACKHCKSPDTKRYGFDKGKQRYHCNACGYTFLDNQAIPKMQNSTKVIADSLNMHYEGMSLNEIRRNFIQQDQNYVSKVTPYNWERRFTKLAETEAAKYHPHVGAVWQADEMVIHNNWGKRKKRLWLIDIIDRDTRFLLETRLSVNRSKKDIALAFKAAKDKAGTSPHQVLTDGWVGYPDAVELVFGSDTSHVRSTPFVEKDQSTNIVERVQGTVRERTKVMRGLKTLESMRAFLRGWVIHYNYFRPHLSLHDRTPAQAAGVDFPYHNWKELIEKQPFEVTSRIPVRQPKPTGMRVEVRGLPERAITTRAPRLSERTPRITPKFPRLTQDVDLGGGIVRNRRTGRQHLRLD